MHLKLPSFTKIFDWLGPGTNELILHMWLYTFNVVNMLILSAYHYSITTSVISTHDNSISVPLKSQNSTAIYSYASRLMPSATWSPYIPCLLTWQRTSIYQENWILTMALVTRDMDVCVWGIWCGVRRLPFLVQTVPECGRIRLPRKPSSGKWLVITRMFRLITRMFLLVFVLHEESGNGPGNKVSTL